MPLATPFTPFELDYIVQMGVLALSIFNLVAFLWLACTVWLNGDRRSMIAYVGVTGLALSAFFFFIQALLIYHPFSPSWGFITPDFLWHLIWLPALGVPYIWFIIGLHYASLINHDWRRRRPLLLICSGALGFCVLVLLIWNRSTFSFAGTMRLLAYSDAMDESIDLLSPLVLIPVLFLLYVAFCAIGPWFTPARVLRVVHLLWRIVSRRDRRAELRSLRARLVDTFWDDQLQSQELKEPVLSWHLARPGLLLAALLMVGLIMGLGILGIGSMFNWLRLQQSPVSPPPSMTAIPFQLMLLDMFVTGSVALITLLVGYSIVRHGILIERPLARRGFFEQWRGVVIMAATVAVFIVLLLMQTHSNLGGMLLITSLATGVYALFTWSSYTAHDRYIALLRPFLRRTALRHWLNTDLQKTERSMEDLFFHLCHDVLGVRCARLVVLAGPMRRNFTYRWPDEDGRDQAEELHVEERFLHTQGNDDMEAQRVPVRIPMTLHEQAVICWVLPIYDELGLVATLSLGPREDGSVFTEEDMDLAQACGQRILDTLRDHEAMQAVAGLLRRRIVDVKLLGAQHRRVLHDEILPLMHLALLRLESLRPPVVRDEVEAASPQEGAGQAQTINEVVEMISDAHRRLASMMRATTPSAPHRLERDGMMHAIHTMIKQDFQQAFDEVEWQVSEETARRIDESVPPALAELIFAAVQEALRNAARHARGSDLHRHLCLTLRASCNPHIEVIVADDGIGILSASSSTSGTGGGLLTHSALLAVAGGSLSVKSVPGEGATVRIFLPVEALR